jgi:hypothetical protein
MSELRKCKALAAFREKAAKVDKLEEELAQQYQKKQLLWRDAYHATRRHRLCCHLEIHLPYEIAVIIYEFCTSWLKCENCATHFPDVLAGRDLCLTCNPLDPYSNLSFTLQGRCLSENFGKSFFFEDENDLDIAEYFNNWVGKELFHGNLNVEGTPYVHQKLTFKAPVLKAWIKGANRRSVSLTPVEYDSNSLTDNRFLKIE